MTINLGASLGIIVLVLVAALLGGAARWLGGKMQLPDWASLAFALFVFGVVILTVHVA